MMIPTNIQNTTPAARRSPVLAESARKAGSVPMLTGADAMQGYDRQEARQQQQRSQRDQQFAQVLEVAAKGQGAAARALAKQYGLPVDQNMDRVIGDANTARAMKIMQDQDIQDPAFIQRALQGTVQTGDPVQGFALAMQGGAPQNALVRALSAGGGGGDRQGLGGGVVGSGATGATGAPSAPRTPGRSGTTAPAIVQPGSGTSAPTTSAPTLSSLFSPEEIVALRAVADYDPEGAKKMIASRLNQSQVLTTRQKRALGLPPGQSYQRDASGKISLIGGGGQGSAPVIKEGVDPATGQPIYVRINPRTGAAAPISGVTPRPRTAAPPHETALLRQAQTAADQRAKADAAATIDPGTGMAINRPNPEQVQALRQKYLAEELQMRGIDPAKYMAVGTGASQSPAPAASSLPGDDVPVSDWSNDDLMRGLGLGG